ncbi:hypothetical protein [Oryzobacter terrae]|uniref:hypothetical protein n=1 Tax=Oryzobacter terrae TaxID=1620385 RepID=UPI00366EF4B4
MTFDDLPENWPDLPLDTPGLAADVADLFVGERDREAGCVAFLLAGPDLRMTQPLLVHDVAPDADAGLVTPFLARLGPELGSSLGGLVFVRGRPGSVLLTDTDRRWHEAVIDACARSGLGLIGAYLATPSVVRAFPEPLRTAGLAS